MTRSTRLARVAIRGGSGPLTARLWIGSTLSALAIFSPASSQSLSTNSGASDVFIPADVFLTLLRTGTVSESDFLDSKIYSLPDGSKLKAARFVIRELRVGNQVATDVVAGVGPVTGDLLLGLSFLSRFGTVTLDNDCHVLILSGQASAPLVALNQTKVTGRRSSLARMASADFVQTKGLGLALCTAR
jgi:hypothetical protein